MVVARASQSVFHCARQSSSRTLARTSGPFHFFQARQVDWMGRGKSNDVMLPGNFRWLAIRRDQFKVLGQSEGVPLRLVFVLDRGL